MQYTLIANSGIQLFTFKVKVSIQDKFKMWFHEWYDTGEGKWRMDLVQEVTTEDNVLFYNKHELFDAGYLNDPGIEYDPIELRNEGIHPLKVDDRMVDGVNGEIYKLTFSDKHNAIKCFENQWLPLPYFFRRTEKRFKFSPMNWARAKFVPTMTNNSNYIEYDVILAFDTRAGYDSNDYNEYPVFPDQYCSEMLFDLCDNEFFLMDYCSPNEKWSYIDEYIFKLVHPALSSVSAIKGANVYKMSYIASYIFLIDYLAQNKLFPTVKLYKDHDVEVRNVDMVVDIGNSRTTALLIEDNSNFNQVKPLQLIDYTDLLLRRDDESGIRSYNEPFDMRLAFRRVDFGSFGINDSKQFVYPSLVRLGQEANALIHRATESSWEEETLSTYSSPKRYLWDNRPSKNEWEFLVLPGEKSSHILNIKGISSNLMSDGRIDTTGSDGGRSSHYSRRSLMTFAFLEMITQANTQINSESYRTDVGWKTEPRKIKRIIITCPTAMSKIEREALVKCAKDAVTLHGKFSYENIIPDIEIIPAVRSKRDDDSSSWYYDEATCAQLVYIYGEVGHKYKGVCSEFFNLYGKNTDESGQPTLTVGSLDIGAGTSDVMICEYSYEKGDITTITPDPQFYDSFYFAGDDMLKALVKNIMLLDERQSAFRKALRHLDSIQYRQKIKNFFGPDYNGQTRAERIARRDFNIQYSVPLMTYFLELASNDSRNCIVKYDDVFSENYPNARVIDDFKTRMGIDITSLVWEYDSERVTDIISKEFEPLLKKIAAMFFAYSCDVILLSGRPSSLPAIRNIFLKYYPVSPNRLITLNNYYVGDWYPFCQNTGYITNPKTIVAMGGVIGHYASEYSNLDKFSINLGKLKNNLKSTVNYIESSRDGQPIEYLITPDKRQGELMVSRIPEVLNVRQLGLPTYPSRALYSIDFNYMKLMNKLRNRAFDNGKNPSDAAIQAMINKEIDELKKRMPFKITIERDEEDKESLVIVSVEDRNGSEISDSNIEIHIQSLGADYQYWLDSGEFDF